MTLADTTVGLSLAIACGAVRMAVRAKVLAYRLAGWFYGSGQSPAAAPDAAPLVYVIRNDALGDCLISIPVIKALCEHFHSEAGGHCRVCLVMGEPWATLFRRSPWPDEMLTIPSRDASFRDRAVFYRTLAQRRPAKVITLPLGKLSADFLARMCGCRDSYVIDMRYPPERQPSKDFLDHVFTQSWSHARKTHGILLGAFFYLGYRLSQRTKIRAAHAMTGAGHAFYRHRIPARMMESEVGAMMQLVEFVTGRKHPVEDIKETDWLCDPVSIPLPPRFFVYGVGNSRAWKRLSPQAAGNVVAGLCRAFPDHAVVFTGIPEEAPLVDEILRGIPPSERPDVLNLCGVCTVPQVATVLRRAHFMVSYDTGTGHLAGILGVPVFVILAQAAYGSFFPNPYYRRQHCIMSAPRECAYCNWQCPHFTDDRCACIADIRPEDVVQTVVDALKQEDEAV